MSSPREPARTGPRSRTGPTGLSAARLALVGIVFAGAALLVYAPALDGPFVSDDRHYVQANPYVHDVSLENLAAILNPRSIVSVMVENYAPVHLLLHSAEWQLFGENVTGYHVVNVILHALTAVLLIALFQRTGIHWAAALAAGGLFLVHPANVEAVAWISQLKSPASLALALGALLAHPRRPALGAALFTLALFAKPLSAFALPVLVLLALARPGDGQDAGAGAGEPVRWGWIGVWIAAFIGFSVVELSAWTESAGHSPFLYADPVVRVRSSVAGIARYFVFLFTGQGLSTFHEPPPAVSWLDPYWLAGAACVLAGGARAAFCLRARRAEAAYWAWALAAWIPISGLFLPLSFPIADRYLYFIMPGLMGAGLLAARSARLPASPVLRRRLGVAALVAALLAGGMFARTATARARVWQSAERMMADSVRHYPTGVAATLSRARNAARAGDAAAAVAALRRARERGWIRVEQIVQEPAYQGVRGNPDFEALIHEMAGDVLEHFGRNPDPSQLELRSMAAMHRFRGELDVAIALLERAALAEGPFGEQIQRDLSGLRRERARRPAAP